MEHTNLSHIGSDTIGQRHTNQVYINKDGTFVSDAKPSKEHLDIVKDRIIKAIEKSAEDYFKSNEHDSSKVETVIIDIQM